MDFTLDSTLNTAANTVSEADLNSLNSLIEGLQTQLNTLKESLENLGIDYNGYKVSSEGSITSINGAIDRMQADIQNNKASIDGISNSVVTDKLSVTEASIQNAHILSLKADSIDLPEIEPTSIKTTNGNIDSLNTVTLNAQNATVSSANIDNLEVKGSLTAPGFNAPKLTSTELETENAGIKEASIQKLNISGVPIESIGVKYSGWTNGYLHKLNVRANGILVFKLNNASIVVTPGNISSNYDKLYAAYKADDGYWDIYLNTDLECQLLVIGTSDFSIADSLVLKSSVRRNADSMGQPNDGENIKVVVLNKLPSIGQRNVIYIILGDCAYYCDGQYFYEMASKKRS